MRKWWFLVPCCLLPLFLCSHPRLEDFEDSIGRIAQDDMIRRFGYPQRLKKLQTGTEVWDYEFLPGNFEYYIAESAVDLTLD